MLCFINTLTLKAVLAVANIGISFDVPIAFVAILFTCAFLSHISPLSSAVGVGFRAGLFLYFMSVVMVIPGVAVAVMTLARSRPFWWSCVYWCCSCHWYNYIVSVDGSSW